MKCWRRGRRVTALPAGLAVASVKLLAQTGMYRPFRIQYLLHCVAHCERSFLEEKSKMRKKKNVLILEPRTADKATSGLGILSSKRHLDGRVSGVLRVCVMPRKLHRTSPHCWIDAAS